MDELLSLASKELGLPSERLKIVAKGQPLSEESLRTLQEGGTAALLLQGLGAGL